MNVIELTEVPSSPPATHADNTVEDITAQDKKPTSKKRSRRRNNGRSDGNTILNKDEDIIDLTMDDSQGIGSKATDKSTLHSTRSRSPADRRVDSQPHANIDGLFFVDTTPTSIEPTHTYKTPIHTPDDASISKLVLPAHVSVHGNTHIEIIPLPTMDPDDEGHIKYLDYDDDRKDFVRYFDDPEEASKQQTSRTVCKKCGAEGEHKTSACTILICLTCGARNEHLTRQCPISKTCYNCGMKGHINSSCPNRGSGRGGMQHKYDDCDRCGSPLHQSNECPTLWRLYHYLRDEQREQLLSLRKSRRDLKLGEGGEGYIADDEWCYNCGGCGHWGDECEEPHVHDIPKEPSAFGIWNLSSGPFSEVIMPNDPSQKTKSRSWEQSDGRFPDDWGKRAPENVGKQARKRERERLGKRAQQEVEDDQDDWFGKRKDKILDRQPAAGPAPKKLNFDISLKGAAQRFREADAAPKPLLERLSHANNDSRSRHQERQPSGGSRDKQGPRRHRDSRGRNGDWERDRRSEQGSDHNRGPRYRGGYR